MITRPPVGRVHVGRCRQVDPQDRGRVIIHTITMSPAFIEQGRDKLSDALDRIHSWETSPGIYNRQEEIEHIAEPPAWGWR